MGPGRWLPGHPVIEKLEGKKLSRAQIAGMMTQIYRQTCEVVRWFGYLYAKCPVMAVRREIFNNLMEEEMMMWIGIQRRRMSLNQRLWNRHQQSLRRRMYLKRMKKI